MGNCLEPSESEIQKAKRARIMKMAALEASMGLPLGGSPHMPAYPYPPMDPYNDPRLTGIYIPSPPTLPQPSAYAVVDPRTGQGYMIHDPGSIPPTSAIPIHIPLEDGVTLYHSHGRYTHNSNNINNNYYMKSDNDEDGDEQNNMADARDGGAHTSEGQGHHEKNGINGEIGSVGVKDKKKDKKKKKGSAKGSIQTDTLLQNNAASEAFATIDVHADENHNKTQHANGDVRTSQQLFTKSGVMDLEAETEPIIIDFLDPIMPAAVSQTKRDSVPSATTILGNVEYESAANESQKGNNTILNGLSTKAYEYENVEETEKRSDSLPGDELRVSNDSHGSSAVRFQANSVKGDQQEMIDQEPDAPALHSTSSSRDMEIEVFPPKRFEAQTSSSTIPDILKKTLSQTDSRPLPSDPVDVVITYSVLGEYELDIVRRLTRQLEMVGLTVWAERLGDSSMARKADKTAEAILGAKVLIVMLSEGSCEQRFIRDHVAIATMTNISIFPVASEPPKVVKDALPRELKVQLALYAWTELVVGNEDSFLFQLRSLARSVQDEVEERASLVSNRRASRGNLQRQKSHQGMAGNASGFWDVHFGHRESVKWERMEQSLKDAFKMFLNDSMPEDLQSILFAAIKNRITGGTSDVNKSDFVGLCQSPDKKESDVWEAVVQVAGVIQAVRDVFDIESTVRHLAVEYNEHFSDPTVATALRDLLSDPDPNFRSVTVVSLARCMAAVPDMRYLADVERTLEDPDRLVREAGCLALGHLRAQSAVKKLIHVWRNDVISQVREAAKMALDQIGGQEVIDAMRVTDVLANEIRELTDGPQDNE